AAAVQILTPHAMKGYEAELVFVVGADRYRTKSEIKARVLYTAMTRARALLFVTATREDGIGGAIVHAIEQTRQRLG
ncbi:MAG: ATP-binding domain-containing protein, partial [Polyangiaceae bacterium]|nr:ATP-binding domain-containing protein [Polyangiaceae bacterium]